MKRTLVIGNGFDLDVGLKTRYIDFAESKWWPFKDARLQDGCETLAYTLNKKARLERWFDVEEAIYEYARQDRERVLPSIHTIYSQDRKAYEELNKKLIQYLRDIEDDLEPANESKAIRVLDEFYNSDGEKNIYTFNYTDLSWIAQINEVYYDRSVSCNYIHGSIGNRQIILGVGSNRELKKDYSVFYKTSSPIYKSSGLINDLLESDEIIIFGHSLGTNDYPYFESFFKKAASLDTNSLLKRRKITIYTKSYNDRLDIECHLRQMVGSDVTLLKNLNDFYIICNN